MPPGISMEVWADSTLASSKCLSNQCDVFLILMQQQHAITFTNGKLVAAHRVNILANRCVTTSILSHWFISMGFLFQFSSLHLDCASTSHVISKMRGFKKLINAVAAKRLVLPVVSRRGETSTKSIAPIAGIIDKTLDASSSSTEVMPP